tara:strand:- start:2317 stop:2877 length:561 start_codon:yes stop_codon:yes gene_type:complete
VFFGLGLYKCSGVFIAKSVLLGMESDDIESLIEERFRNLRYLEPSESFAYQELSDDQVLLMGDCITEEGSDAAIIVRGIGNIGKTSTVDALLDKYYGFRRVCEPDSIFYDYRRGVVIPDVRDIAPLPLGRHVNVTGTKTGIPSEWISETGDFLETVLGLEAEEFALVEDREIAPEQLYDFLRSEKA